MKQSILALNKGSTMMRVEFYYNVQYSQNKDYQGKTEKEQCSTKLMLILDVFYHIKFRHLISFSLQIPDSHLPFSLIQFHIRKNINTDTMKKKRISLFLLVCCDVDLLLINFPQTFSLVMKYCNSNKKYIIFIIITMLWALPMEN